MNVSTTCLKVKTLKLSLHLVECDFLQLGAKLFPLGSTICKWLCQREDGNMSSCQRLSRLDVATLCYRSEIFKQL